MTMESLSATLQPHKELIGAAASYVTIAQFFSGGFICNDIRKKNSTHDISSIPFVGGIVVGLSMMKYAALLQDDAMLRVNVAAIGLNVIYCLYYYTYSSKKWEEILKPLAIGMALVGILLGYGEWEKEELIEFRYGLIVTIMMLLLLGSPLVGVKEIIAKQDASSIPFVMTLMGTVTSFLWLLYSIVLLNDFMLIQNVLGFVICFVQVVLIFIYPGGEAKTKEESPKSKKKTEKKTN